MQKNIILSMHQPFWLMIAMGRKKLELRTTKPKGDIPFKVYVYVSEFGLKRAPQTWQYIEEAN